MGKASFHPKPVAERLASHLKRSGKLFMDETRAPVLDPGRGRTRTGWLWALARDDRNWGGPDPPGVVYFYAPGRGGEHAERFLKGFKGVLQVDGYAACNRLAGPDRQVRLALCWAHCRRKLREAFDSNRSGIAAEGLRRIAKLYAIEAEIHVASPERRLAQRQARTAPLVEEFGVWLKEQRARVSAKRLGENLAYIARHWDGLRVFLDDGRVEMDSHAVENRIGPPLRENRPVRGPRRRSRHVGELIHESIDEVGWNVTETAARLGCERGTPSRLLNGKAGVSADMALEDIGWGTTITGCGCRRATS